MLVIVIVNQSITERPPLQDELSTSPSHYQSSLRQSLTIVAIARRNQSGQAGGNRPVSGSRA
jgi:hypothetical protein